jgi:hypothetical protein
MGETTSLQAADEVVVYCRETVGNRLRTVTRYSLDDFDSLYLRDGILEELEFEDGESREMFRIPVFQLHRKLWEISYFSNTLDDPEAGVFSFGDVAIVQIPIAEEEGIIVSLESDGDLPGEFVAGLKAIVSA